LSKDFSHNHSERRIGIVHKKKTGADQLRGHGLSLFGLSLGGKTYNQRSAPIFLFKRMLTFIEGTWFKFMWALVLGGKTYTKGQHPSSYLCIIQSILLSPFLRE
jgi:hypothetical protein